MFVRSLVVMVITQQCVGPMLALRADAGPGHGRRADINRQRPTFLQLYCSFMQHSIHIQHNDLFEY